MIRGGGGGVGGVIIMGGGWDRGVVGGGSMGGGLWEVVGEGMDGWVLGWDLVEVLRWVGLGRGRLGVVVS